MIAFLPIPGGHIKLAERFFDPALSFTMGWNYWYNWTIILPAELSAAAVLINFWNTSVNNSAWIVICLAVVVFINFLGAGMCTFVDHCRNTLLTLWVVRCLRRSRIHLCIDQSHHYSW